MKRTINELDFEIDSLTNMMKESNMLDGEDEYNLLLEGYNCMWDESECFYIMDKAISRYNRYLRNVKFGEYKFIEELIKYFLKAYDNKTRGDVWSYSAMEEMREIDGEILQIVDMERREGKRTSKK
jgi:hypothetical protein